MAQLGGTVYDRFKQTGYLTGPSHRYGTAMSEAEDMSPPETEQDEDMPPNLRDAGNEPGSCADCMHSEPDEKGLQCMLHGGYPVKPSEVCDDYDEDTGENQPMTEEGGQILSRGGGSPGGIVWARGAGAPDSDNSNPLNVVGARSRARAALRR